MQHVSRAPLLYGNKSPLMAEMFDNHLAGVNDFKDRNQSTMLRVNTEKTKIAKISNSDFREHMSQQHVSGSS